ncbi:hypothetical protein [Caulobacter mirabilis]|nr:hypothetical protein [Caulobacter mirabilis]
MSLRIAPGETVLWQGRPAQGLRFLPQDVIAVPFAAFWLLVVLLSGLVASTGEVAEFRPAAFVVFGLFLLIGLYALVGRFLVDVVGRRKTRYTLTSERAVIESGLLRSRVRSVDLTAMPEIRLQAGFKGRGAVHFGSTAIFYTMVPPSWPGAGQVLAPAFHDIDEPDHVHALAVAAQREALGGRAPKAGR